MYIFISILDVLPTIVDTHPQMAERFKYEEMYTHQTPQPHTHTYEVCFEVNSKTQQMMKKIDFVQ